LQSADGANVKAGPQAVAKDLFEQDGLILIVQGKGALSASLCAEAAAVAFVPVNLDYFPFRHKAFSFEVDLQ
jgi:hypothetical protein